MPSKKIEEVKEIRLKTGETAVIFSKGGAVHLVLNLDKNAPDLKSPQFIVASAISYLITHDPNWLDRSIDLFLEHKLFSEGEPR